MKQTPNYGLPIYEPNDVTSYLTTYNQTMTQIDADMKQIEDQSTKNTTDIAGLEQQASSSHDEINELTGEVSDLKTTVSGQTSQINGLSNTQTAQAAEILAIQNKLGESTQVFYSGVLSANEETLAIAIGEHTDNLIIMPTCSVYGLAPLTMEVRAASGGQPNLIVSTWTAQSTDVNVTFVVWDRNTVAQAINVKGGK